MADIDEILDVSTEDEDGATFTWLQAAVQEVLGTGLPEVLADTATLTLHPHRPA